MTRERFQALAEAYGGDLRRWPAGERDDAQSLLSADPDWTRGVLAEADGLDGVLQTARPAPASRELVEGIVASAPGARPSRRGGWLLPAGLGAGLAAASVAGLLAGVQLSHTAAEGEPAITAIAGYDSAADIEEDA